jgi:hypothetical protein
LGVAVTSILGVVAATPGSWWAADHPNEFSSSSSSSFNNLIFFSLKYEVF